MFPLINTHFKNLRVILRGTMVSVPRKLHMDLCRNKLRIQRVQGDMQEAKGCHPYVVGNLKGLSTVILSAFVCHKCSSDVGNRAMYWTPLDSSLSVSLPSCSCAHQKKVSFCSKKTFYG